MTIQSYIRKQFGTPVIWGESGGSLVTHVLSLDALASGSAVMGAVADLGENWDEDQLLEAIMESGTAPTAQLNVDVYLAWSRDGVTWPAGVTGSAGAWPADGDEDQWARQLGNASISVVSTNDGTTAQTQKPVSVRAIARYVAPIVDNNWDQALRDVTPNSGNVSRVKLTPVRSIAADAL